MAKKAFDMMMEGLNDAIAFADGDTSRARVANVDVKAIRVATGKNQAEFARTYDLPVRTVQEWEQQRRAPDGGSRVLLRMIAADPEGVATMIAKSQGA